MAGLDPKWLMDRQGKQFCTYPGLLDLAHQEGLSSIKTSLLQVPSDDNGNVAICFAEVTTSKGTFTGIGDASPANVSRNIAPHIIRMAETRSKARALRDATNIGMVAIEELDDDEPTTKAASKPAAPPKPQTQAAIDHKLADANRAAMDAAGGPVNATKPNGLPPATICANAPTCTREIKPSAFEGAPAHVTEYGIAHKVCLSCAARDANKPTAAKAAR